jgi:hypothetical protein
MRTLKFIVDGQILKPDPNCDFGGLVPGTSGYLQAEFTFSSEWNDCLRAASFYSSLGTEYEPQPLVQGCRCVIPAEALERRLFMIRITGLGPDKKTLKTNKCVIYQNGGKA